MEMQSGRGRAGAGFAAAMIALGALATFPTAAQEPRERGGSPAFQRCGACHLAPDPGFGADRVWLEGIRTTA